MTITPTPTQANVTKVVLVPGMGGSWNQEAILNCDLNAGGTWGPTPYFSNLYNGLDQSLSQNGFTVFTYYYDWRKQITQNVPGLNQFILSSKGTDDKIDLVGHSMGGLLGRAYLENQTTNSSLYKFLTAGSPHKGTVVAYPAWSSGELWSNDLRIRVATTLVQQLCSRKLKLSDKDTIRQIAPSFQNILPTFDYLKDKKTNVIKSVSSMQTKNNWLPTNSFDPPFYGVTLGTLAGIGVNTLTSLVTNPPSKSDTKKGLWSDGKPVQKIYGTSGDGTVLSESALLSGTDQILLAQDHGGIVSSPQGIGAIVAFLKGDQTVQSLSISQPQSETSALVLLSDAGIFTVEDPSGNKRTSDRGMVAFINPKSGSHKLFLQPKSWATRFIVAQFLSNGKVKWKEYNFTNILPKWKSILFNSTHPSDNPLH
jgi:pimeloyl-ACP methyl ester carboxylesterase